MRATAGIYAAVALGSALGAVARYLLSVGLIAAFGPGFPWGTLAANMLGSLLIGLYATLTGPEGRFSARPATRHFVIAGVCGGFTTFSIFSLETLLLVDSRAYGLAASYVGLSLVLWLGAVWAGHRIGVRLNG